MKTYLVTGGAGFIGSNFVKYLLKKYGSDVTIVVLDALTYAGNLLTIKDEIELPNVSFVKGDIGDHDVVSEIFNTFNPDYVANFAAESHVDRSITNPRLFLETNILGTQNMLDCAREAWRIGFDGHGRPQYAPGKRFLQISTDEVYGSLHRAPGAAKPLVLKPEVASVAKGRTDLQTFGEGFFTEQTPLAPNSPYSASKTSADLLVRAYHETYNLPINITRCSNNYGPYHFPEKLIPLMIKNVLEGKKLPVYGKGDNVRDWLFVEDHCKAIDMVLRNGENGEVYNVGGFNEQENISIVKTIIAIIRKLMEQTPAYQSLLSIPVEAINEELITYVADRPGHDMRYAIDPEKIATKLGWYPETSFAVGIEKTVKWYLDNPEWTASVTSGSYRDYYKQMYGDRSGETLKV